MARIVSQTLVYHGGRQSNAHLSIGELLLPLRHFIVASALFKSARLLPLQIVLRHMIGA